MAFLKCVVCLPDDAHEIPVGSLYKNNSLIRSPLGFHDSLRTGREEVEAHRGGWR